MRAEFARVVELLGGRATAIDAILLEMLAFNLAVWREAVSNLGGTDERPGMALVVMSGGTAIANPSIAIATAAQGQIVSLCNQIGMPAALRRRLGGAPTSTRAG